LALIHVFIWDPVYLLGKDMDFFIPAKSRSFITAHLHLLLPFLILFVTADLHAQCIRGNCLNGNGTIEYPDGSLYVGEFINGVAEGNGVLTKTDGSRYEGGFKNGQYHGLGSLTAPDGFKYEGQHKNGRSHGRGIMTLPNGVRFLGQFENGYYKGPGTLVLPDGRRVVGEFEGWGLAEGSDPIFYEMNQQ